MQYFYAGTTATIAGFSTQFCGIWIPDNSEDTPLEVLEAIVDMKKEELENREIVLTALNIIAT